MLNPRFVVLTGHLSNYPLSDIVGILRHQRKSGRLLIEYPGGPASFFFQDGQLVDAQLNELSGLQAICVALGKPEASFNFNPLVKITRRSIDQSLQRVVSELLGCWDDSALEIETTATANKTDSTKQIGPSAIHPSLPYRSEPLALPPARSVTLQNRSILLMSSAGLMMLGLSTVIAVTGRLNSTRKILPSTERTAQAVSANAILSASNPVQAEIQTRAAGPNGLAKATRTPVVSDRSRRQDSGVSASNENDGGPSEAASPVQEEKPSREAVSALQSINVVMQIENGRVLKASIANHKPGNDGYEALALRIARQRRYPEKVTGEETVKISVTKPE
jgi:Domain of unknown function (DUF4388)